MKTDSRSNGLRAWSNSSLVQAVGNELQDLLGTDGTDLLVERAYRLLEGMPPVGEADVDVAGIRAMLYQIVRNRDPEMKLNHVTELNLAAIFATHGGRTVTIEHAASERNGKLVDFALFDAERLTLVEVKNLNRPLIKRASDESATALLHLLKGTGPPSSDLHFSWIFFRKPRPADLESIAEHLRAAWQAHEGGHAGPPLFLPETRPVVAALFPKARPDTGGRIVAYDHGDHLGEEPGARILVKRSGSRRGTTARERVEELCIKDNILRRIQDAEAKFPLQGAGTQRIIAFSTGAWLPAHQAGQILREACHWYLQGTALEHDFWRDYYPRWQVRWKFTPLHNVDAIVLLAGDGLAEPYLLDSIWTREGQALDSLFAPSRTADPGDHR